MSTTDPHGLGVACERDAEATLAMESAGVGSWRWDLDSDVFHLSRAGHDLLGAHEEPLPFAALLARVHPDDKIEVTNGLRRCTQGGGMLELGFRMAGTGQDGRWMRLRGRLCAFLAEPTEARGILIDDPRRSASDAVNARLAAIVASSDDAIIAKTLDGIITDWNHGAEVIFGYAADAIIGKPIELLLPAGQQDEEAGILARLKRGDRIEHFETRRRRKDGAIIDVSLTASPLRDASGRLVGASKVARDITAAKRAQNEVAVREKRMQELQNELIHMSRFNALGEMASTLAHELSQPLSAVANYLKGARRLLEGGRVDAVHRACEAMDLAAEQALRAGQIIRHMRDFVARGESERHIENLTKLIEDASALALVGMNEEGVHIAFDFDPKAITVFADKIQIQQVLLNLIRNAVEAMQASASHHLRIASRRIDAETLEVSVADTGTGIADEVAGQLFQPFVTTKRQGMGVGLSISRTIIEAHGGRLWAEPNPGGGTIFRLTLRTSSGEVE